MTELNQIVLFLLDNAVKYTDSGSIEFGYTIATTSLDAASLQKKPFRQRLQFYVKDTGIGISKEKLNTIFDRFQTRENEYTKS